MSGDGETFFVDKVDFSFDGCVGAHRDVGTFGCAVCNIGGREGRADTQVCPYGVCPPINKSCGTFHDYGRSHRYAPSFRRTGHIAYQIRVE